MARKRIELAAVGKRLGNPNPHNLTDAQRMGQAAANREAADAFARNVLPIVRQVQAAVVTSLANIAQALNDHGVRTSRGGAWHNSTVRNLLQRTP